MSRRTTSVKRPSDEASPAPLDATRPPCLTAHPAGCALLIVVATNAKATRVEGLHDGRLKVRLAAQPIEGAANAALLKWLGQALGLPVSRLTLEQGQSARRKRIAIAAPYAQVHTWLATQVTGASL